MDIEKLKSTFNKYVEQFDMCDTAIIRKYYHSLRVMNIAGSIAKNNNFSESDIEICILVGLLHDYARFFQWTKYKTFNDNISLDHGDLAVKLLFDDEEIKNYTENIEYYDEIKDAIKYHNKYAVSLDMSKHNSIISKVIRDADKLDIFYLFGVDKEVFKEDDKLPSKDVIEAFYQEKVIDSHIVKSKSDNILLDLAMIYDLNFDYSFKYIKENKLVEKMYENVNNKALFKEYFDYINNFIDERIEKKC